MWIQYKCILYAKKIQHSYLNKTFAWRPKRIWRKSGIVLAEVWRDDFVRHGDIYCVDQQMFRVTRHVKDWGRLNQAYWRGDRARIEGKEREEWKAEFCVRRRNRAKQRNRRPHKSPGKSTHSSHYGFPASERGNQWRPARRTVSVTKRRLLQYCYMLRSADLQSYQNVKCMCYSLKRKCHPTVFSAEDLVPLSRRIQLFRDNDMMLALPSWMG